MKEKDEEVEEEDVGWISNCANQKQERRIKTQSRVPLLSWAQRDCGDKDDNNIFMQQGKYTCLKYQ